MSLPELDYDSAEALQSSAESRATAAMIAADVPYYFKGMGMRLTASLKSLFLMLRDLDGARQNEESRDNRDMIILLYLMTQNPKAWNDPIEKGGYLLQPLRSRPADWLGVIDDWADSVLTPDDLAAAVVATETVWDMNHATRMVPDNGNDVVSAEKKTGKSLGKSGSQPRAAKSTTVVSKKPRKK